MSFLTDYDPARAEAKKRETDMILNQGAFRPTKDLEDLVSGYNYGASVGEREFFQDPRMIELEQMKRARLRGYDSQVGGAIRATGRGELAGQQEQNYRKLASVNARQGVGGARAGAMMGAQMDKGAKTAAEQERKMALDSYQEGQKAEQDFAKFRQSQKFGKMSSGTGFASAISAQNAASKQANAGGDGGKW